MLALWKTFRDLVANRDAFWSLARATLEHRGMEKRFQHSLKRLHSCGDRFLFPHMDDTWAEYFQHNFFSILFLSIYEALGIPKDRRCSYAMINHALRGVVTAADNILDGEEKGSVKLGLNGGHVLRNVFVMLMQEDLLQEAIREVAADEEACRRTRSRILDALFEIALEESGEEEAVEVALPVEEVLRTVHSLRGGRLLELAFIAPEVNEPQLEEKMKAVRSGIHQVGVGLQVMDDLTDFGEDLRARNHNVLRSWIVHRGTDGVPASGSLPALPEPDLDAPERRFPRSVREVLNLAMERALEGFSRLHSAGHPIDRPTALRLAQTMFRLRGLEHLWELYAAEQPSAPAPPSSCPASILRVVAASPDQPQRETA